MTYREKMEESLEGPIEKGPYKEDTIREFHTKRVQLERKFKLSLSSVSAQEAFFNFLPLKDEKMHEKGDSHVHHYFMSLLKGRGMKEGPSDLFIFPDGANEPRLLCLRGNNTSNGALNSYALAFQEEVPTSIQLVPGITLIPFGTSTIHGSPCSIYCNLYIGVSIIDIPMPKICFYFIKGNVAPSWGARGFLDEAVWQRVVKKGCEATPNCNWSVMYITNLTFFQQVEVMSRTNILVSAHRAQLANMIFMPPRGRIMEMFPRGWLEMAGHGQYIYRNLVNWVDLQHEGGWRDPYTSPCPNPSDVGACFSHCKNQPLGINVTYIENWLGDVIKRYQEDSLPLKQKYQTFNSSSPHVCECKDR
ncbi:hypothetical protein L7F22_061090 [Adiantum nelumboides]|nr:hypothetical protein [Adiantum nelumboides]